MLYQRKLLADMSNIGEPGPLPRELQGSMSDADLAHIGDLVAVELQQEYGGQGFFPVEPASEPAPRFIHKVLYKTRFTPEERIAIRVAAATNPVLADMTDLLDSAENVDLDSTLIIQGLAYLVSEGLLGPDRPAEIRA